MKPSNILLQADGDGDSAGPLSGAVPTVRVWDSLSSQERDPTPVGTDR